MAFPLGFWPLFSCDLPASVINLSECQQRRWREGKGWRRNPKPNESAVYVLYLDPQWGEGVDVGGGGREAACWRGWKEVEKFKEPMLC